MPTNVVIIVSGVVSMFAVFVAAMGWAAYYTRNVRVPGATYFDNVK